MESEAGGDAVLLIRVVRKVSAAAIFVYFLLRGARRYTDEAISAALAASKNVFVSLR